MGKDFNVLDMANQYAAENQIDPAEIFKQHPVSGNVRREALEAGEELPPVEKPADPSPEEGKKPELKASGRRWTPGAAAMQDLPEANMGPVTYAKDEIKVSDDPALKNIADENAARDAVGAMKDLERTEYNIEALKRRRGYAYLEIPDGYDQASIRMAAADTDYDRAQRNLDVIFTRIEEEYPQFIVKAGTDRARELDAVMKAKYPGIVPPGEMLLQQMGDGVYRPPVTPLPPSPQPVNQPVEEDTPPAPDVVPNDPVEDELIDDTRSVLEAAEPGPDVKVVIDKSKVSELSWSPEEVQKLRRSRSLELNIVETDELEFSEIEDIDGNAVDVVLESFRASVGSVSCVLPASKYRCTVTGLSYPEVLDLQTSQDMNAVDAEYKKWSIAFDHIHNPSIGAFQRYWTYPDENGKRIKVLSRSQIPQHLVRSPSVHEVSAFEDFLDKTSYADLEFILWKILCATVSDKEIISIKCKSVRDGVRCTNTYDWVYNANELLDMTKMNAGVLEDMREAGEATSREECMKVYRSSQVCSRDTVKLPVSGWKVVFGHISAHEYLEDIFPVTVELRKKIAEEAEDPTIASQLLIYTVLQSVKAILIPSESGKWKRVRGSANLEKLLSKMNQTDWNVMLQITNMVIDPYSYDFVIHGCKCPKCHSTSNVSIDTIRDLLFIVARSLMDVNVELKRI